MSESAGIKIGWAKVDVTPDQPVLIAGQFHARVSEGVSTPITATVLVLDSGDDHAVFVSCDFVTISASLLSGVRERLHDVEGLDPVKVVLNATHTHTGPETRQPEDGTAHVSGRLGVELDVMSVSDYVAFAAGKIAGAVRQAWASRAPGAVAYGQGTAVVGRNRRWVSKAGTSTMYGQTNTPDFSHIEGYEDHVVNVLATANREGDLTGVVVNVHCPSQVGEQGYELNADYWHDTRLELQRRLGDDLFVLAQCSAAGDQSPHLLYEKRAAERMFELKGRTECQELAHRISDAVQDAVDAVLQTVDTAPVLRHRVEHPELSVTSVTPEQVKTAVAEAQNHRKAYEAEIERLAADPEAKKDPRWYVTATRHFRRMQWFGAVKKRFEQQAEKPKLVTEVHVLRLGDIVIATNRFEYYLDFGIAIKARSPALQTFVVQLAGQGTYVPTQRSTSGGGYGSIPASNLVGPEGGRELVDKTVEMIDALWN